MHCIVVTSDFGCFFSSINNTSVLCINHLTLILTDFYRLKFSGIYLCETQFPNSKPLGVVEPDDCPVIQPCQNTFVKL